MAKNFITETGSSHKTLKGRINTILTKTTTFRVLVGFFYFSGWKEVYESLQKNPGIKVKLLIGLQVDQILGTLVEHGEQDDTFSYDDHYNRFISSLHYAINNDEMDNETFYNQVRYFLDLIIEGRLIIRKTENPNHAKLYLFQYNEGQSLFSNKQGQIITGSSNLTKAGLSNQEEFNVEIRDYGYDDAVSFFEELWDKSIPITEDEQRKKFLIEFIEHKSQAANVSPFEAYALILKTYLEVQAEKQLKKSTEAVLDKIGFKKYSYQLDAVNQALGIIDKCGGVIIADVVGLGKSVIASLIARDLGKSGMVICPPGLIGDPILKTGWWGYVKDFELGNWDVISRGKLQELADNIDKHDAEVIIVDEAHYFRNQDTDYYEALSNICRNRIVILLTATPFNNSPADIFSLLKLFIVPGKSSITLEDNLEGVFSSYSYRFRRLSHISKYHASPDKKKRDKAENYYTEMLGEDLPIDLNKVRQATQKVANKVKRDISEVVIRRNRIDLKTDYQYAKEIDALSEVQSPKELFFELSKKQSDFYDRIIKTYFAEDGVFKGAIYRPFSYETIIDDEENLDREGNRRYQQQNNLYDFMRRLLVKRFESSFGSFAKSIDRFIELHEKVKKFIKNSGGRYILDRSLLESIYTQDEEFILDQLDKFEKGLLNKKLPKNTTVYKVNDFERKDEFYAEMDSDHELFKKIKQEITDFNLVDNDPKREKVYNEISSRLKSEKENRKFIIFSEYVDTVNHLATYFRKHHGNRVLVCDGKVNKQMAKYLNEDFNAQHKGTQTNHFDILITSDKLSEGFNLNRAGAIINYDIPWNPTRVIQRVGRINRIGAKVFDKLFIFNFFPTEKGSDIVKSREIASQKMFLIHNSLGEDAQIFDAEEKPSAAKLYQKVNQNSEEGEELNILTQLRNAFSRIKEEHPEIIHRIENLPPRVKTAKKYQEDELNVLQRKGIGIFPLQIRDQLQVENKEVELLDIAQFITSIECGIDEQRLKLSDSFWESYNKIKFYQPKSENSQKSEVALETKAHKNLKVYLKLISPAEEKLIEFMKTLIKDIKKYHTLSDRTLGRLGRKEIKTNSNSAALKEFHEELVITMKQLGEDYLEKANEKVKNQRKEIIIAIENLKNVN